jgi:CubicO group peptidase (beta-lactamase class C family)
MKLTLPEREELQGVVHQLAHQHGVPGASVGVLVGDDIEVVTTGVARLGSRIPITPDTAFLIASITKVWTATLVMQLVDGGLVDVEAPVNDYLDPALRLADPIAASAVTVEQLLCHTGGFFGDADAGGRDFRGADAVRRAVEGYDDLVQLCRPGHLFSYSNSGYNVLGRLVECVTGLTWDEALRQHLVGPLGLSRTSTLTEETMTRQLAIGHVTAGPDSLELRPVSTWLGHRASGPCGGTLATTANDLLQFARLHLRDGVTASGTRLMSAATVRSMREPRVAQPDPSHGPAWAWGWAIEHDSPRIVGHIGSTAGQQSRLAVVPEHDLAICVLTNGDPQGLLHEQLVDHFLQDLVGAGLPAIPAPVDQEPDPAPFVGTYWMSDEATIHVTAAQSGLQATFDTAGRWSDFHGDFTAPLAYTGGTTFRLTMPPMTTPVTITFVRENEDTGPVTHIAHQMRLAPRVHG